MRTIRELDLQPRIPADRAVLNKEVQNECTNEAMDEIKTPKVERVLLRQFHHSREYVTGTLCLTDTHLIFVEPTGAQETWVLYHHINSMERLALTTRGYPLTIETKIFQQLHLIIPRESDCVDIMATIKMFAQPESYSQLYAYQYKPSQGGMMKQSSGWALYDSQSEYGRMGLPNEHWKHTSINTNYELCDTYSSHLYVPTGADRSTIIGSTKFRSKGRLPVLSFYYEPKKSALCRSSQPLAGFTRRSAEDEQMVQAIINANPNSDFIYVVDTRPKINAIANKAQGKGYEKVDNYTNVVYEFYNIHNIHVMRESLQKMVEAACSPTQSISGFLSGLEASGWMKHIHLILETSIFIAKALHDEGVSVLVHCSDGWDRTAQTCGLASLLIDPYYRTLHGFMILIEKEWLSFGHKFSTRSGHLAGDSRDFSPIFSQFLECVWQVTLQYPTAFQFNEHLLLSLHAHLHSCQFGTFLGNCEKERIVHQFSEDTYSFWGHVWSRLDDFLNPLYGTETCRDMLTPTTDIPHLSFWYGLYCRYHPRERASELSDEMLGSLKQQNTCMVEHIKFLQQNIVELRKVLARFQEDKSHCSSQSDEMSARGDVEHARLPKDAPELNQPERATEVLLCCDQSNHLNGTHSPNGVPTVSEGSPVAQSEEGSLSCQPSQAHTTITDSCSPNGLQMSSDYSSPFQSSLGSSATSDSGEPISPIGGSTSVHFGSGEQEAVHFRSMNNGVSKETRPSPKMANRTRDNQETETSTVANAHTICEDVPSSECVNGDTTPCEGKTDAAVQNETPDSHNPLDTANSCTDTKADPTAATQLRRELSLASRLSPDSYTCFKEYLNHVPEMNLPWQPLRSVWQCPCGTAFSYSSRKYHCSYCGVVVCGACGGHQASLPFHATAKLQRVCRTCFKLMRRRMEDLELQLST